MPDARAPGWKAGLLTLLPLVLLTAGCTEPSSVLAPQDDMDGAAILVFQNDGFNDVSPGSNHTCGLKQDGTVVCWGMDNALLAVPADLTGVVVVSASYDHTCAVKNGPTGRSAVCWGLPGDWGYVPADIPGLGAIQVGAFHACGTTATELECWGSDQDGRTTVPVSLFDIMDWSVGATHTCAVLENGTVACWGSNNHGKAVPPADLAGVQKVSAGNLHTCALKTDGTVTCWGHADLSAPVALTGVTQITAGDTHACALKADKTVVCWGMNDEGQLNVPAGLTDVRVVRAGRGSHTCAISDRTITACWGMNNHGQANLPSTRVLPTAAFLAPTSVVAGTNIQLALLDAQIPGYPTVTFFTYAFDCGTGAGYTNSSGNTFSCPTSEAGVRTVKGRVSDAQGDAQEYSRTVKISAASDGTPPVITPAITGKKGLADWYTTNVSVSWIVSDAESDVTSPACETVNITTDVSGQTVTCNATSAGGTAKASVTIKRDATAPVLNPAITPSPVVIGASATAVPNGTDAMSGVATASCGTLSTGAVGTWSVQCIASDNAGNASSVAAPYAVVYDFVGFGPPISNGDVLNVVKAGRTIALKWQLRDASGAPVTDLASAGITVAPLSCAVDAPADPVDGTTEAGSGLQNLGDGHYQLNWRTSKDYANSCVTMQLDLGEGSSRTALFRFNR